MASVRFDYLDLGVFGFHVQTAGYLTQVDRRPLERTVDLHFGRESALDIAFFRFSINRQVGSFRQCDFNSPPSAEDFRVAWDGPIESRDRRPGSISRRSASSPSRRPISGGFRRCGWPMRRCERVVAPRLYSMRRTKSRLRRLFQAGSGSAQSRGWSRRQSRPGFAAVTWRP